MMKRNEHVTRLIGVVLLASTVGMIGCSGGPTRAERFDAAYRAYDQRDYQFAYQQASQLARISQGRSRDEAIYLAGLSAQQLNNDAAAESYLRQAVRSSDPKLAADALGSLGLVHVRQGRYAQAASDLLRSAKHLTGEDQANAYFYAAIAQQKIGRWAQARTNLILARTSTRDAVFRKQVESQLSVTGYTIQTGAFRNRANAKRAADVLVPKLSRLKLGLPRLAASTDRLGRSVMLVQIGRYATFSAAQRARQQLGDKQSIIVPLSR